MRPSSLFLTLGLLYQMPLAAAANDASPGLPAGAFLQAFLGLLFIVALLVGTAWFARKLSGGQGFGHAGMRMIGGVALGPRERIVLVEVGDAWLVIGIVPGQIRTLHTLPKGSISEPAADGMAEKPFALWLKNITERRGHAS